jgi:hypothetical protein
MSRKERSVDESKKESWMKSVEVKHALNIGDCDLMHIRLDGKLRFKKQSNTFLYAAEDVE